MKRKGVDDTVDLPLATKQLKKLLSKEAFIIWCYTDPLDITYHLDDRTYSCHGMLTACHVPITVLDTMLRSIYANSIDDYEYVWQY